MSYRKVCWIEQVWYVIKWKISRRKGRRHDDVP